MPLNICGFSEVSFQLGTPSLRYECRLYLTSGKTCLEAQTDFI